MTTRIVLVYDAACGDCSAIAARLAGLTSCPVVLRSCRDPRLATEFPPLAPYLHGRPCRRPLAVVERADGSAVVTRGAAMMLGVAAAVRPGRRWAGLRLGTRVLGARARRRASLRELDASFAGSRTGADGSAERRGRRTG